MSFANGENIGPYRIIEQLGQGGMATVYKAYHAALDRYVALKVLHPAFGEDPNFEARFQREARLVAKLDHPNIVPIFDYSEHDKQPFLVMKFIEGETLKARMARGPLSTDELGKIIESVGSALAYAHKMGILHRDIKPSNVLLTTDGSVYLADFGLARIASMGESTLSGDMIMGTPQYISPEQALGKKDLDEGTDIYSFGVMLYEMIVGQVPFNADTPFSIIHDHIYTPLPIPHTINPSVPDPVERVLLKALAKERADRYASVTDMVTAFMHGWHSAGVPMVGTTVTLASHEMTPRVAAAGPSSKKAAPAAALPAVAESSPKVKKKRSRWPFIAAGVLLVICCLFALIANGDGKLLRRINGTNQAATATATLVLPTASVTPQKDMPTATMISLSPTPSEPTPSPAVLEALHNVEQNPNDPQAHLALAMAYWDNGQPALAYETLNKASSLVSSDDRGFFLEAARQFAKREAWIASAAMYLRAIKIRPFDGTVPPELEQGLHEAAYKAAKLPELPHYLPFDSIAQVDQPIAYIAEGRYNLYKGDIGTAREFLNRVRRLDPDMPEASLLEAEILIKEGKRPDAKRLLNALTSDLEVPEWIRVLADSFLIQFP